MGPRVPLKSLPKAARCCLKNQWYRQAFCPAYQKLHNQSDQPSIFHQVLVFENQNVWSAWQQSPSKHKTIPKKDRYYTQNQGRYSQVGQTKVLRVDLRGHNLFQNCAVKKGNGGYPHPRIHTLEKKEHRNLPVQNTTSTTPRRNHFNIPGGETHW